MKKIILLLACPFLVGQLSAQFKITVQSQADFPAKTAYLYTLDGSKDILNSKAEKKGNAWVFNVPNSYRGMLKVYFPETNGSVNFISENKDVNFNIISKDKTISDVAFLDDANKIMNSYQEVQQKKQYILPALYQIKEYYKDNTEFGAALNKEILSLSNTNLTANQYPFVAYYTSNYNKYLVKDAIKQEATPDEIKHFITNSGEYLETSSLIRPLLVEYLNKSSSNGKVDGAVDSLLTSLNVETPRGQTVLSELIDIFDIYGMPDMKEKYLSEAKNLKCTINDRLTSTINSNVNTEIGAKFPNYTFIKPFNTKAKTLYDVKADKKVVVFWSSTCSHCEKELPEILAVYPELKKKQNIEVIGLSLDSDQASYENKAKNLPWINDSELKGWYSTYSEVYNVHATPSYFILDADNKIVAKPDHAKDVADYFKLK